MIRFGPDQRQRRGLGAGGCSPVSKRVNDFSSVIQSWDKVSAPPPPDSSQSRLNIQMSPEHKDDLALRL